MTIPWTQSDRGDVRPRHLPHSITGAVLENNKGGHRLCTRKLGLHE